MSPRRSARSDAWFDWGSTFGYRCVPCGPIRWIRFRSALIEMGDNYPPWVAWSNGSPRIKKCPASERGRVVTMQGRGTEEVSAMLQSTDAAEELSGQNSSHGAASAIFACFTARRMG